MNEWNAASHTPVRGDLHRIPIPHHRHGPKARHHGALAALHHPQAPRGRGRQQGRGLGHCSGRKGQSVSQTGVVYTHQAAHHRRAMAMPSTTKGKMSPRRSAGACCGGKMAACNNATLSRAAVGHAPPPRPGQKACSCRASAKELRAQRTGLRRSSNDTRSSVSRARACRTDRPVCDSGTGDKCKAGGECGRRLRRRTSRDVAAQHLRQRLQGHVRRLRVCVGRRSVWTRDERREG